ncbi:cyclic pyranopterin monophosphate synthase MoaC [Rariglobus hedericola]|uniref:cyclic pyranopterin monophosphate synthase n=1 Tax=Rariglobus hedericola TaxID=2597822 RepID=A0A556QQA3_9BACT|nr:cyclic pyranopterin monophosphate synthase MoaC [Rariglobus hedericola]TSJ78825.1 cyclic pyranopterin monophosphate synthase MoaC [Rariglobus hedericola]
MKKFSHLDTTGAATMVDVGAKPPQLRRAVATGELRCAPATIRLLKKQALPKGDVLACARLAGIMAAKKTADLIPLCHPLALDKVSVDFTIKADRILITAEARLTGKTGVEMEALTAVSVAALTLYDMMKAVDKQMVIGEVRVSLKEKK